MKNLILLFGIFALVLPLMTQAQTDITADGIAEATTTFQTLEQSNLWTNNFSQEEIQTLPIGIKYTFGKENGSNIQAAVGITKAVMYADYAEITVFARLRLPQIDVTGKPMELFFGADKVKLSYQGGIIGDVKLALLGDINIPLNTGKWILTLKGGFNYKTGNTQDLTYATINCDGIKEIAIAGAVEFSRDMLIPVETDGEVKETKTTITVTQQTETGTYTMEAPYRVRGDFQTVISDWNDILVDINMSQSFVLSEKRNGTNYDDNFVFSVSHAVLDMSDLRNSPNVKFPQYYIDNGLLLPSVNSWRGVYVQSVEVGMPKEFMTTTTAKNKQRVSFGSHDLIVDGYGVSGYFYADSLIQLSEGITNDQKAWAYSVDHIGVNLAANRLTSADFNGAIILPVSNSDDFSNKKTGLKYTGLFSEKEYILAVKTDSAINFNLWKAKGQLQPNSYVEMKVKEGKFRPKAVLNGFLSIQASNKDTDENDKGKKPLVSFDRIEFQNLTLQTEAPIFKVDYMGYKKGQNEGNKVSNFPVTIDEIGITANDYQANLYLGVAINLMDGSGGFSGRTRISILGSFEDDNNDKQKWVFKGVDLAAIDLCAKLGPVDLNGSLRIMENDPEYGDGFSAHLDGKFGSFGPIICNAIFGSKDFRYWMVDASISGLNIGAGVINLDGFAGGASYRMLRKTGVGSSSFMASGLSYTPDADTGLGVKAMVSMSIGNKNAIVGKAGFEIIFNKNGGVNQMGFYGEAEIMAGLSDIPGMDKLSGLNDKLQQATKQVPDNIVDGVSNSYVGKNFLDKAKEDYPSPNVGKGAISAFLGMQQDFVNNVFHAELEIYVNIGGVLVGRGPNNRAAKGVIHVASNEWYAYLGRPSDRAGLKVGVGSISVSVGGYFMVGSRLEDSPPPPPVVAEILGVDAESLNYMRDENALNSGRGFAFGMDLGIDTGDLRFLIFYARLQVGCGFDIMIRDYSGTICSNTGEAPGINGWYANGQAYAYLQGELGIQVKLFFVNMKVPIISAGAAVLLQAKAPNPVWMRGYVGGHYNVLGGLLKGSFRFKLTLGEECDFADISPLGGVKIISDVSPDNNSEADVFAIPQATFAMKVGEDVIIPQDSGDKIYKINLDKFRVIDRQGKEIEGKIEWNQNKDAANFTSKEILPPNTPLKVEVQVSFMEKVNGIYKPVTVDGQQAVENETREFTTGGAPDVIPLQNIQYAYPVLDQKYFFTDEYKNGYIQLKRGQSYLFDDSQWTSILSFTDKDGNNQSLAFSYSASDSRLNYQLPKMNQSKGYHLSIVSRLKNANTTANQQQGENYVSQDIGDSENTILVQQNKAQSLSQDGEIERLAYDFSTSQYKTLKDKVSSMSVSGYNFGKIYSDVIYLTNKIKDHEDFDIVELAGSAYTDNISTVSVEAVLDDDYFIKDINPLLYSNYPLNGIYRIKLREEAEFGIPPAKALPLSSSYLTYVQYGINKEWTRTTFPFDYQLPYYYKLDWTDMQNQIINDYVKGALSGNNPVIQFMDAGYKFIRQGDYRIRLKYRMPGGITGTEGIVKYKNSIGI